METNAREIRIYFIRTGMLEATHERYGNLWQYHLKETGINRYKNNSGLGLTVEHLLGLFIKSDNFDGKDRVQLT